MVCLEARPVKRRDHGFNTVFCYFYLPFFTRFLGCSGPLDNAKTIPEWLKKNLNKFAKSFKKITILYQIGQSCNLCSTNNL